MKTRKRRSVSKVVVRRKKGSFLPLDFLKHPKLPFHGAVSGLALIIIGSLVAVSLISVIGLILFVPSVGSVLLKFFKKRLAF